MDEYGGVKLFRRAPHWLQRNIIEIQSVDPSEMSVCVNVGADLRAT